MPALGESGCAERGSQAPSHPTGKPVLDTRAPVYLVTMADQQKIVYITVPFTNRVTSFNAAVQRTPG
jgi:hypothetical protein